MQVPAPPCPHPHVISPQLRSSVRGDFLSQFLNSPGPAVKPKPVHTSGGAVYSESVWNGTSFSSCSHCPRGAREPAMTRGRAGACPMTLSPGELPAVRRCQDTCSSPVAPSSPSNRPCRQSWSLRWANPSAGGTTAAGSLRILCLREETQELLTSSHPRGGATLGRQ